jgi:gamma-glutamyltranspeptidase / glutathione hydrolase
VLAGILGQAIRERDDMGPQRRFVSCFSAALLGFFMTQFGLFDEPYGAQAFAGEYDRPAKMPHQSRSAVLATHGIVAASQPLAAQVGLEILKAGGTAADAAIATNAMLGLVEPMSNGIGGDIFVCYWDAKTHKLYGLNGSGRSPYALNREIFKQKGLKDVPGKGVLSWSVPGCVDGWDQLRQRFGTMSFQQLLAPAIQYAEEGFPVSEIIGGGWGRGEARTGLQAEFMETYYPNGKAPRVGELFRNPNLAASLRAIARGGRDAFYRGPIARQIVAASESLGGYFSMKDFEDHRSEWVQPVSTNYRGYDVWELPPNGQRIAALEILNILEGYDIRSMGRHSPDYLHLFIEAKKLAYADRAKYFADPTFHKLPVAELISKEYAARQRKRIDMQHAATSADPGEPLLARQGDTIYLSVVDKDRNCCSLIQSNSGSFGSFLVPGKTGFVIQNRGNGFSLDPNHLNRFEPHKRPFHTIIPAMVTKNDKPWFCFGVMGGDFQPQGHVQVLVDLIDFDLDVQAAGDEARVTHSGSQTPSGHPMDPQGGKVSIESGIPLATMKELERRGHHVDRGLNGGGYQGIRINQEFGTLEGATEPRKDGAAVGY